MPRRSSKSLLHAHDSTALSSSDMASGGPSGGFLVLGDIDIGSSSCPGTGVPRFSLSSSFSFYHCILETGYSTKEEQLAFRRSDRKRLKRFHRPAIPATSDITLSMSRGFTSSSEGGPNVGFRAAVGEDIPGGGKLTFATSASYSCSTLT
jgi:hypothetical protein